MSNKKDAAAIKALEELGLRKQSEDLPSSIKDLQDQLSKYDDDFSSLDPNTLKQYLVRPR